MTLWILRVRATCFVNRVTNYFLYTFAVKIKNKLSFGKCFMKNFEIKFQATNILMKKKKLVTKLTELFVHTLLLIIKRFVRGTLNFSVITIFLFLFSPIKRCSRIMHSSSNVSLVIALIYRKHVGNEIVISRYE